MIPPCVEREYGAVECQRRQLFIAMVLDTVHSQCGVPLATRCPISMMPPERGRLRFLLHSLPYQDLTEQRFQLLVH